MINQDQTIPCPVCNAKIHFDVRQLMSGVQFACPDPACGSSIGLAPASKTVVQETMQKLEAAKGRMSK